MSVGSQRRDPCHALVPGWEGDMVTSSGAGVGEGACLPSCVGAAVWSLEPARKAASLVFINDPSGSCRSRRDIPDLISHSCSEVSGLAAARGGWTDRRTAWSPPVSRSRFLGGRSLATSHLLLLPHPQAGREGRLPRGSPG